MCVGFTAGVEEAVPPGRDDGGCGSVTGGEDTASQLQAIEKRLAAIEQENAKLKERISELEKGGTQEIAKQLPGLIPQDETEKKAFFDKFRREFKSSQDQARGPWTSPEPWT